EPQNAFYSQVKPNDIPEIIDALLAGDYIEELLYRDPVTKKTYYKRDDIPFFKNQQRTILGMNQKIDPIRINDYIGINGYAALARALIGRSPARVVDEVKASGLRGRGGAGFPTGLKWEMLAHQKNGQGKYLVCNADEGDPGAYMDRSVLEGNPHLIIEGMIIGAYGTGATEGVVYVRNEYPIAIKHLTIALEQAREYGLLGEDILGTGFSFDINLVRGAGAFVCGEETALIQSIEGKIGEPRQRPPFPIQKGINGKPTIINNVETWANIPVIIKEGAQEFAMVGTENNSGTKIFSLVGKIKNTGLVEVPMGITIREIVYDIGGGSSDNTKIKAVQTGGPSGGCIPAEKFDLHIDYDSLSEAGSIMGSGGMIVMDENTCMVDVAKYFMNFLKDESCGKCFTCRKGTQRLHEILDDISKGQATLEDLDLLKELAHAVKDTTMCGLGQTASNPVLSTLRYYYHEYQRHVVDKKCDAFVCKNLIGAACQSACPVNTEAWRYVALIEKGLYEEAYKIIRDANPFPSVCARVCDHKCEQRCSMGVSGGEPIAIRALKRFITDRVDPSVYKPARVSRKDRATPRVAVIGAGPAGLSASHYLSLSGYKVTLFEADDKPGGMLISCIPSYRLPREVLQKEINALLDENITLKCKIALGRDITVEKLFADGFQAIFLAIGAHKSMPINLKGEDAEKVYPSLKFLKAFNLQSKQLAQGRVVVVGGGNSAVDAARVALRQKDVESVTLLYRRTRQEMPAFEEEIEAALAEGVKLQDLVTPVKIKTENNQPISMKCIKNKLQGFDSSDRPRPIPVPDTEFDIPLDTLIVAIGEQPDGDCLNSMGLKVNRQGTLSVDMETFCTDRQGVFAGGDLVSGSNTVIDAIAAGKKAAGVIDRYLRGKTLKESQKIILPEFFIEPAIDEDEEFEDVERAEPVTIPVESRRKNFNEVEISLTEDQAICEARRCLRCDLEFTQSEDEYIDSVAAKGKTA
ncbi:FAD-dependent oxidoreductase, partial [Planctomycetota bacterium]